MKSASEHVDAADTLAREAAQHRRYAGQATSTEGALHNLLEAQVLAMLSLSHVVLAIATRSRAS